MAATSAAMTWGGDEVWAAMHAVRKTGIPVSSPGMTAVRNVGAYWFSVS